MTRFRGACLALMVVVALAPAEEKKPEPGFTELFNGKGLDGWHVMNQGQFSVRDGVIFLNKGGGWLRSDKEYKDFELRIEFRFLHKGANSGIYLRATKEGGTYPSKTYQVQTMDHPSLGSIYTTGLPGPKEKKDEALLKKVMKPVGEWQVYLIAARGPKLTVKVNGELINEVEGLAEQPGHIGIQGEGGQLEFKSIQIKAVP